MPRSHHEKDQIHSDCTTLSELRLAPLNQLFLSKFYQRDAGNAHVSTDQLGMKANLGL
ncbi:hypothetical protein LEP3755_32370 [Leptolyngbya sp. NIES-3755]|nr:hypothetical protein LEP3755_32370 [Leptolyngbya sp. NIES-3755]